MKTSTPSPIPSTTTGPVQRARLRLATAQGRFKAAKEEARVAKRQRQELKLVIRRARKAAKEAKATVAAAAKALTEIEARLAKSTKAARKSGKTKPIVKVVAARKKPAGEPRSLPSASEPQLSGEAAEFGIAAAAAV